MYLFQNVMWIKSTLRKIGSFFLYPEEGALRECVKELSLLFMYSCLFLFALFYVIFILFAA